MARTVFISILALVLFTLTACESDPVPTNDPVGTAAIKPADLATPNSSASQGARPYTP